MLLGLLNMVKKEMRQTLRDRPMTAMLIIAPMIQLIVFGYAINLDVDRIPTVVCDQDDTQGSRHLSRQLLAGGTFVRIGEVRTPNAVEAALKSGEAAVAIIIPPGFSRQTARRDDPSVQVLVDGTDTTRAQVAINAASRFLSLHGIGVGIGSLPAPAPSAPLQPRILYNPTLSTAAYMLPGILAALLLAITAIITAMGIARERETGTLEQVLVTPIHPVVFLTGKCIPFIFFGLIDVAAVLLLGSLLFDLPMRGPIIVVGIAAFLYLFSTLGVGIVLATVSPTQQQAMLGAAAFMLPAVLLSGFLSPIENMPAWLQPLTYLNPLRYFIAITRACLLKGAGFSDLLGSFASLALLGIFLLTFAVFCFRKRIA